MRRTDILDRRDETALTLKYRKMKELKDFLKELEKGSITTEIGDFVTKEWAARLISEAYIAGMNFQEAQKKGASNGRV